MSSIHDLKGIVRDIYEAQLRNPKNNVVTNTVARAINREADFAFGAIQGMYHPSDVSISPRTRSNTQVLLMKPVGDHCNLKCEYCYEIQRLSGSHEKVMEIDQMRTYLTNFVGSHSDITDIFLHGGEPMLAGKAFFEAFVDCVKSLGLYGKLTLGVQTNGTLLDQEWVDFFREHEFSIGVSLDGDKAINDRFRVDHKGKGSYDQVMKGIRLLQQNDMAFGIISVVSGEFATQPGIARRILEHHVSIGAKFVDIHPAFTPQDTSGDSAECNMSRDQYTNFMTELAYAWAQSTNPDLRLRCIEDLIQNLTNEKSLSCFAGGFCTSIVGIDPSGAVSPCTRPFNDLYTFGNAGQMTVNELEEQPSYKKFVADEGYGQHITKHCEWSSLCGQGNCPHERFTDGKQDPAGKHIFCACHDQEDANNGYPGFYKNLHRVLQEFHEWQTEKVTV